MARRKTYAEVKNYIEVESDSGCLLLSEEYKNNSTNLKIQCKCGNSFSTTYASFRNKNKTQCDECTNELLRNKFNLDFYSVKNYIEEYNCLLMSSKYINAHTNLEIKCLDCECIYKSTFSNFKKLKHKCTQCAIESTIQIMSFSRRYVEEYLLKYKYRLLSDYKNCDTPLKIKCPEGHTFYMDFYHFKNREQRCPTCYLLKDKCGENSATWQGGKTNLNYMLRNMLDEWKFKSLNYYGFKCVITKTTKDLNVHHVKSFNKVVDGILDDLNISPKKLVGEYTKKEIDEIEKMFLKYHNENLGIPITKDVHVLFHSEYGWDNNEHQLKEFIKNYRKIS